MPTIHALDNKTIRRVQSGQVITSIEAIVKELVENSLDASAKTIDINLVNDGLRTVEVKDDGSGIVTADRCNLGKRHYTSKLFSFSDLESVRTYGFRGEALNALCEVSENVSITTKTKDDIIAICYSFDNNGCILSERKSNVIHSCGTLVTIHQPFYNLPVRRQVTEKGRFQSIKHIQESLIKYGLSHSMVRFRFHQTQSTLGQSRKQPSWIKPSTTNIIDSIRIIYGSALASMVQETCIEEALAIDQRPPLRLHCVLPSKKSDPSHILKGDHVFIYADQRPINYVKSDLKELVSMVRRRYTRRMNLEDDSRKNPFMYIDIQTGLNCYDVNIEPDKSVILFIHKDRILNLAQKLLDQVYGSLFMKEPPIQHDTEKFTVDDTFQKVPNHSPQTTSDFSIQSSQVPYQQLSSHPEQTKQISTEATGVRSINATSNVEDEDTRCMDDHDLDDLASLYRFDEDDVSFVDNPPRMNEAERSVHHKETTLATMDEDLVNTQMTSAASLENIGLDWQIDDKWDVDASENSIGRDSQTAQVREEQENSHPQEKKISDWFAQFRRQPDTSNDNTAVRRLSSMNGHTFLSVPTPAKRPRIQFSLPFSSPSVNTCDLIGDIGQQDLHIDAISRSPPMIPSSAASTSTQNTSIFGPPLGSNRRRDISALFTSTPSSPTQSSRAVTADTGPGISLSSTLNRASPFVSDTLIHNMIMTYPVYRDRHSHIYRKPLSDYRQLTASSPDEVTLKQKQRMTAIFLKNRIRTGVAICAHSVCTNLGRLLTDITAVDMTQLYHRYKFQKLMEEHELNYGKTLSKPMQMTIRDDDPLYGVVLSLDKREQYVLDDGYGATQCSYSLVIDRKITANGFRVRWKKEAHAHEILIQMISISNLDGYGPDDFTELLNLLHQEQVQSANGKVESPLSKLRPVKVIRYLTSLAKSNMTGLGMNPVPDINCDDMLTSLDQETQQHFTTSASYAPLTHPLF